MGFTEVLTLIFVTLKLIGTIDWSWWLVFLPEIIVLIVYVIYRVYLNYRVRKVKESAKELMKKYDRQLKG